MMFEKVSFSDELCSAMTKEEFVELHGKALWQDRTEEDRRKMLEDAYELIGR